MLIKAENTLSWVKDHCMACPQIYKTGFDHYKLCGFLYEVKL